MARGAHAVQADPVHVPAADQRVAVDRHHRPKDRLHVVPHRRYCLVQMHPQSTMPPAHIHDGAERRTAGTGVLEVCFFSTAAEPGRGRRPHIEVVCAVHAAGPAPTHVRQPVRPRVMCEMTGPVRVQLRGQLAAAATEQSPAPKGVVLVSAAECVQLDRFHRKHQRLLRVRATQDRRLNLPPVTPQNSPHPSLPATQIFG